MSPQRQGSPSAAAILVCPISPAAPRCPAQHPAAGDDAEPEAGGRLDEQQVAVPLEVAAPLGQRHHVGVVVDEDRRARSAPRRYGASSTPSQPAMIGESRLGAAGEVDGAGDATARPRARRPGGPTLVEQVARSRATTCGISVARGRARPPGRGRADGEHRRRRGRRPPSWVRLRPIATGQHDAGVAVEPQVPRRAGRRWRARSPRRPRRPARTSSSAPSRAATAVRDRPVSRPQVAAGERAAVADQARRPPGGRRARPVVTRST